MLNEAERHPTSTSNSDHRYYVEEAADYLDITKKTLYKFVSQGKLFPHKPGKRIWFLKADLDEYIEKRHRTPAQWAARRRRKIRLSGNAKTTTQAKSNVTSPESKEALPEIVARRHGIVLACRQGIFPDFSDVSDVVDKVAIIDSYLSTPSPCPGEPADREFEWACSYLNALRSRCLGSLDRLKLTAIK